MVLHAGGSPGGPPARCTGIMSGRTVVVTGMGIVSPLGCDLGRVWERLMKGQSGVRRIQRFDVSEYSSQIGGELVDFNIDDFISKKEHRFGMSIRAEICGV